MGWVSVATQKYLQLFETQLQTSGRLAAFLRVMTKEHGVELANDTAKLLADELEEEVHGYL